MALEKIRVIRRLEGGLSCPTVHRYLNMAPPTVTSPMKNADKFKKTMASFRKKTATTLRKLKQLLVYNSETLREMKGHIKTNLLDTCISNRRAGWHKISSRTDILIYFCPRVHLYCDENNYPWRALLLLDSALEHPPNNGKTRTVAVKDEYLPSNTTSLLQPMTRAS
jgi:hypothetical protein